VPISVFFTVVALSKREKLLASAQKSLQKGQLAKAIKDYQQILQLDSGDVRSRQKLAELLGRDRRTEEALGEYEAVAKHYAKTGFYLKAIAVYKQMQKLDPAKVDIYHRLAELNEKQGLVGNALAEYRNLVAYYEKQKMHTEAASVLQKMRELEPENLNILVKIAETYAKGGLKDRARGEFDQALAILRQKEDFSRVLKLYEIFLPLYPDRPDMKIGMAQALIEKGDTERGMHILKNLLQDDPEHPEILAILAQGYRKLKDFVNERLTFQHLLRNASEDLDLRAGYIRACIDSGEPTRALDELESCRDAFLAAERAFVLQGFYEELKQDLPQNEQIRRSLQSIYPITTDEESHSADISVLLEDLDPEPAGEPATTIIDFTPEPAQEAQEVDHGFPAASEEPVDYYLTAEEGEDLEIPLEFLEDVAAGDAVQEAEEHAAEEHGLELELELELDLEPAESSKELKPDSAAGGTDEPGEDTVPFDEEILDLELEDDLVQEEFSPSVDASDAEEEILDLDMSDALEHDDPPAISMEDLRSELEEAEFFLQQGLLEDAERICRSLMEGHPDRKEILNKLSEIEKSRRAAPPAPSAGQLFDLEEELADEDLSVLEEGIDAFADSQRGIETRIDVEDTESHYNLGIAYKEMGLLDEAVAEFDQAVHNPARRLGCLMLKGMCLVEKGSFDEAEDAFKSGMAHPGLSEGERISLLYELGLLYERWNKHLEALDSFQSVADADLFFRDVGEKVAVLRKKLGMDVGEVEGESRPKGDKNRVSYV
jgi:tetratricopeptide (TPR) repeat protein